MCRRSLLSDPKGVMDAFSWCLEVDNELTEANKVNLNLDKAGAVGGA